MANVWMSFAAHTIETCHNYEWVMLHTWMSHATPMNKSCHMCEWVISHIWRSHATHMNGSCHMYEWVTSRIWISHVTYMNESCHMYEWIISHVWMSHVKHVSVHVTHTNESCHVIWDDSWVYVPSLIHMCDMTGACVHEASYVCDMTHSYVLHGSCMCVTWFMSHMWMSQMNVLQVPSPPPLFCPPPTLSWAVAYILMRRGTHMNARSQDMSNNVVC